MTDFVTMSPKGQALFELMLHSLMAGFRLRAVNSRRSTPSKILRSVCSALIADWRSNARVCSRELRSNDRSNSERRSGSMRTS